MKRLVSIILVITLIGSVFFTSPVSLVAKAATSGSTGDCTWTLSDGVLTISGNGEMGESGYLLWGKNITRVIIEEGVTSIGSQAFCGCSSLTSVEIPKGVTSIGSKAFDDCSGLISVEIPEGVTEIGYMTFCDCSSLTSVKIPTSVTYIGVDAFGFCRGLTSIEIPKGVTHIGDAAFTGCHALTNVVIPGSVARIGDSAFCCCYGLVSVQIEEGVTSIGSQAFYGCSSLTCIEIPESITNIESYAFEFCKKFQDVWYKGNENDKKNLTIEHANEKLLNATWHYNSCMHAYDGACDDECNKCHERRVTDVEHDYKLNKEHTCEICKFSKKPDMPILSSVSNGKVTLIATAGFEYSKDGTIWQENNIFSDLINGKTYVFYQRIKESAIAQVSETSGGLEVYVKSLQSKPTAPNIFSYTDTSVSLLPITNGEYSIDGTTWQDSNVFENLASGTEYTFFQRYAETDTYEASESSMGTSVTTDKSKQTLIPNAPSIQNVTSSSITLVALEECEYSKDGTTWQTSNVFSDLSCGTEYTFYQRYKETSSTYVGKSSEGTIGKTDKGTQSAPSRPTLSSKTHNSVTLATYSGYEYSIDGVTWQTSNVFTGLNPETNYLFCQRKAETDTHYASEASPTFVVKTYDSEKIVQSEIPLAPVIESCTSDSIILVYTEEYEYSSNGEDWQESNVFSGLSCTTSHIFYQRYKETETTYAGMSSKGTIIPPMPVILKKTYNSISLKKVEGCEYSLDGRNWQSSNIFSDLMCGAEYEFYQRYTVNTTPYVNQASMLTGVKTNLNITLGGHIDKETISVNKCDIKFEGDTLCVLWQLTRGGEIIESRSYSSGELNNRFTLHFDDMEEGRYILTYSIRPYTTSVSYYRDSQGNYVPSYTYTPTGTATTYALIINNEEKAEYILGDCNNDNRITDADALYLLYHTIFGDTYPIEQDCDYNHDGSVTDADALYLLYHTIFGDSYPLN